MTETSEAEGEQRFCTACGTPAGTAKLCEHCGAVFSPDRGGLVEDEGAVARRVFEGREEAARE
ncbi:hypothetical protein ACFV2V_17370 [Streptomyces sp. NPDC059698]|uniref:hypothetical protein n=1 Tax=unclassified Streptomyces TaxID=2593676 RepID=UPI000965DB35|nr:hypothetical protein [Streptomyces sp. CB02366]OKJ35521.1 hypothetical protein AMK24_20330 [Streptomyces sp. CB02366]TVP33879.1 hypothetical protein A3L22_15810 [Streptomyces griseus subsp. griseus]WSS58824.1 hypothetical protein OG543_27260 [Streptomyces sp. NBC_01178]